MGISMEAMKREELLKSTHIKYGREGMISGTYLPDKGKGRI